ncbi:hypothetical protein [Ramlibacter sp.]|uniref:hypothetical protein n=1 Tax=Ramlibacter sp. TaxID=1917967 RepID=UPI003D1382FF
MKPASSEYWKTRCAAAERALQLARRAVRLHEPRREVIAALGELKAGDSLDTVQLAQRLKCSVSTMLVQLQRMEEIGLVDRADPDERAATGRRQGRPPAQWRLGYLVQGEPAE